MDHHWVGGECNHHSDCCSFPYPGATSPKYVLVIGECVRKKLQKSKYDEGCMSCKKFSYTTMLVFSLFLPQPWPNLRVVYLALNGRLPPTVFNSRWLKREIQPKQSPNNPFDEFKYLKLATYFQDWFKL